MQPLTRRVPLDSHDFATVRQLYAEAQQWARHYEAMVVNANVLIISASLIFLGLAFGDKVKETESLMLLLVPAVMSVVGIALTRVLFKLYAACIERMIRLENILSCFDVEKWDAVDQLGGLLGLNMMEIPVGKPASVQFFISLYCLLVLVYFTLVIARIV